MLKLSPILLALLYGWLMVRFSAWRTARELDARSTELADPTLMPVFQRLARALDLARIRVHVYEIEPVNGLAAPDGRIFLTRGFLAKYKAGEVTAEELASVLTDWAMCVGSRAEATGYMLRGFFGAVRRHIAFEREHLVPILEQIKRASDKS